MEITVRAHAPVKQRISVRSRKDKEWNTHFVNFYCEESHPNQPNLKPIGEEFTLCFDSQKDVERFISLIRKATKKIK